MRRPVTAVALLLLTWPATVAGAQELQACPASAPVAELIATAPVVFVGTVSDVTDEDREATVAVTRVWKGGPLPLAVRVRGNVATQSKVHTAIDRTYAKGAQYLFLPTSGSSPSFAETICSGTAPFTNELAALAPRDGGDPPSTAGVLPTPVAQRSSTRFLPVVIGGVAFVGLAGLLLAARRQSRRLRAGPGARSDQSP